MNYYDKLNFYQTKPQRWLETVLLTLTDQEVPGGKSHARSAGGVGAGVVTETGEGDIRDTGDTPLPVVIQVFLFDIQCFAILFD